MKAFQPLLHRHRVASCKHIPAQRLVVRDGHDGLLAQPKEETRLPRVVQRGVRPVPLTSARKGNRDHIPVNTDVHIPSGAVRDLQQQRIDLGGVGAVDDVDKGGVRVGRWSGVVDRELEFHLRVS